MHLLGSPFDEPTFSWPTVCTFREAPAHFFKNLAVRFRFHLKTSHFGTENKLIICLSGIGEDRLLEEIVSPPIYSNKSSNTVLDKYEKYEYVIPEEIDDVTIYFQKIKNKD